MIITVIIPVIVLGADLAAKRYDRQGAGERGAPTPIFPGCITAGWQEGKPVASILSVSQKRGLRFRGRARPFAAPVDCPRQRLARLLRSDSAEAGVAGAGVAGERDLAIIDDFDGIA